MRVDRGFLLITDLSGYTAFLVDSELDHATRILDTLLTATVEAIRAPVRVLNTRGDAVFCYVSDDGFVQPQSLLESIEEIYFEFRRHLQFMDLNTTCVCNACANMTSLDLKVFLHHGDYVEQDIAGAAELQGADVILVNRLMKNQVQQATGLRGYALVTEAAVSAMGAADLIAGWTEHHETYEHFGHISLWIQDLPARWMSEWQRRREPPDPDRAWVVESVDTSAPQWVAWDVATDADHKRIYYDMISVSRTDELGGAVREGSQYHCVHELGDVTFTITEWHPPHYFESDEIALGTPVHFTMQVLPTEDGSTLRILYDEPGEGDPAELEPLFRDAARSALDRLAALLEGANRQA